MMWTQASRPLGFTEKVKTVRVERDAESERECKRQGYREVACDRRSKQNAR